MYLRMFMPVKRNDDSVFQTGDRLAVVLGLDGLQRRPLHLFSVAGLPSVTNGGEKE